MEVAGKRPEWIRTQDMMRLKSLVHYYYYFLTILTNIRYILQP